MTQFQTQFPCLAVNSSTISPYNPVSVSNLKTTDFRPIPLPMVSGQQRSPIYTWYQGTTKVDLLGESSTGLVIQLTKKGSTTFVPKYWIRGLNELSQEYTFLKQALVGTRAKLSIFKDGGYSVEICGTLKGGAKGASEAPEVVRMDRKILDLLREGIQQAKTTAGKDVVALLGNTGTGKSTLANAMLGVPLISEKKGFRTLVKVAEGHQEKAEIGHGIISKTLFANSYHLSKKEEYVTDTGGFVDTRGGSHRVATVVSSKLTLEQAKSTKLLLCYDGAMIGVDRESHLVAFLKHVLGNFLVDYKRQTQSIALVITKSNLSSEELVAHLKEVEQELIAAGLGNSESREWITFLLRENGRYICVADPLCPESMQKFRTMIDEMNAIQHPKGAFRTAYSESSTLQVLEEATAISTIGCGLYEKHKQNKKLIQSYMTQITELQKNMNAIQASLAELSKQTSDPTKSDVNAIKEAENKVISQNQTIINAQNAILDRLKKEKQELESKMDEVKQELKELESTGDQLKLYNTEAIDQKGINIESKTITTHTTKTVKENDWKWELAALGLGMRGPVAAVEGYAAGAKIKKNGDPDETSSRSETSTFHKLPIERTFKYKGPAYAEIKRYPEEQKYWSEETEGADKTEYSIQYKTAPGEDAHAGIEVFVLLKNIPTFINKKLGYIDSIKTMAEGIQSSMVQEAKTSKLIYEAQRCIDSKGSALEKLAIYEDSAKKLEISIKEMQEKLNEAQTEKNEIEEKIAAQEGDFSFLKDYIKLSGDEQLSNHPMVRKFLKYDDRYRSQDA